MMNKPANRIAREDVLVPLFIAQAPQQTLARKGLDPSHWEWVIHQLARVRIKEASVLDTFISLEQYRKLLVLGKNIFGESELIQWWSADLKLVHTGPLGSAVTSANTVRESMRVLEKYVSVVYPPVELEIRTSAKDCILTVKTLHAMPEVEEIVMELTALTLTTILLYLNIPANDIQIRLGHDQRIEDQYYQDNFGTVPGFKQSANTITMPARYLDQINEDSSPLVFQQGIRDCDILEARLKSLDSLSRRAYQVVLAAARRGIHVDLPAVAEKLTMSERTLIRRLTEEGTSFRELSSEVRLELAKAQLEAGELPIKRISLDAGFSNVSSFSRAFRKRTGLSPSEYRSQHNNDS